MNIIYLDKINSTNLYAKENIDKISDKSVISAKSQYSGRGRFNRNWIDLGEGNLFISIVLKPSSELRPIYSNLTQYMSVILCRIFEEYGLNPEIKWPNDVLIRGAKISGILCESVIHGSSLKGLILGVGVNINADKDSLLLVKDKKVTALNVELERDYEDNELFLNKLLFEFFKYYDKFLEGGFLFIKNEYTERCKFLNKEINVKLPDGFIKGKACGFTDSGELILKNRDGRIILSAGDIFI